ncbi:MAG: hypothetical protein ACQKBW_05245 [Puniceicoccales bacterium]
MTTTTEVLPLVNTRVDTSSNKGRLHRSEKYVNTSLRYAPTAPILATANENFGPFKMARIFLTLDEYWDFRDESFHPNYRIGRDRYKGDCRIHGYDRARSKESQVDYLDYIDGVASQVDELLLCVRRLEHEVTNGVISREKYEEVLYAGVRMIKVRHPNLRYLEVLNESSNDHFGGLDDVGYYAFYQSFYRVAARINAEGLPGPELGVGGPVTDKARFDLVGLFLKHYTEDTDSDKRLDFISYHDYASGDRPVRTGDLRVRLDAWLKEYGLPLDLPAYITEMGTHEGKEGGNVCMAAGVPALFEQVRRQHDLIAFPWCIYHDPEIQLWSTQHLPDGKMTPHGMAMAMLALHRRDELSVVSDGEDADGLGVYALASTDESGLCVHVWNYSKATREVRIVLDPLPAGNGELLLYRLDSAHNNVITDPSHSGKLQPTEALPIPSDGVLEVELEPYAQALWLFEKK